MEQKIAQAGISIGKNIRQIRLSKGISQTELIHMLQLQNVDMTTKTLARIERGVQPITSAQLQGIRDCLGTTYDELLKPNIVLEIFAQQQNRIQPCPKRLPDVK